MTYTNFPNGITSMGTPVIGTPTQGNVFFVNPSLGSDGNDGTTPATALATLVSALGKCTANQNDTVYLLGTTNAATPGTYRVAAGGLDWNKDGVNLIGVCSGNHSQQRARISPATTDVTTNTVFTLSANNCHIENISVFHGVASWVGASAGVPTAFKVTGSRNALRNVTMSGLGDTSGSNSMDVSLASSLWLAGCAENLFVDCYVGLNTIWLGNTTASEITCSGTLSRNKFIRGEVTGRSNSVNHRMVRVAASCLQDVAIVFDGTQFTNSGTFQGGSTNDAVFTIGATQAGVILLTNCSTVGNGLWEKTSVSGNLYIANPAVGAGKAGIATVAVGT